MKKLFSSLLAATMLAGASITAFAYVGEGTNWDTDDFDGNDYAIIGAYDEDGKSLKKSSSKVESGDKIYYPILISGDEIDKDETTKNGNSDKMYFANKASEINNLKAYVKDEIGGKYIDGASIVKKDIEITDSATTAGKFDNFKPIKVENNKLNKVAQEKNKDLKVTGSLTAGDKNNSTPVDAKGVTAEIETAPSKTEAVTTIEVKGAKATDTTSDVITVNYDETNNKLVFTVTNTWDAKAGSGAGDAVERTGVDVTALNNAIKDSGIKGVKVTKGDVTIGVDGKETENTKVEATRDVDAKTEKVDVKVIEKQAKAGQQDKDGSVSAEYDSTKKVLTYTVTGANDYSEAKSMGKVYCVEVKMADYYKSSETEVEFNIKLKNKGKTEFDTDDDKIKASDAFFNGTFDLGTDADIFNVKDGKDAKGNKVSGKDYKSGALATKFKKGDIEIKIGKHTRTLQLDEAINKDGNKEDIDNIFLESDDTIDNAFTFDVKASDQDDLYLELNQDANKDLAVSNQKADLEFFNFPGKPEFDFSGTATFAVEDEDEDNYFYEVVDGELKETNAKYDRGDGVFKLRTNKLGSYVISDRKLDISSKDKEDEKVNDKEDKAHEQAGGDPTVDSTKTNGDKSNANTGAADLIGVASALAVVSVATAGVVALKK